MPLQTGNPYLDALGGAQWPEINGRVRLSFNFDPGGAAGAWTVHESLIGAHAVQAWLDVADIGWGDPDELPAILFRKETFANPRQLGEAATPDMSPHVVRLNTSSPAWMNGLEPGGLGFHTLIHELGHALGLAHPHDKDMGTGVFPGIEIVNPNANPPSGLETDEGNNKLNSIPYTIMGYVRAPGMSQPDYDLGLFFGEGYMVTPGAFDIAAIQRMYGAVAHNEGDTVYILRGNFDGAPNASFSTIWDTGGEDTIRYDGSGDPRIDNDAASLTVIDLRYATLKDEFGGGGFKSEFRGNTSNNGGFTIAADVTDFDNDGVFGVIIENAIGGPGRDQIIGNEFINELNGRGGTDTLRGGGGGDRLTGGTQSDTFEFDANWGDDTITDFEVGQGAFGGDRLVFANTINVASLGQFDMNNDGDDGFLKITFGGQSITFNNLHTGDLRAENFSFNRKLQDGYVFGATVFADADGDGELDAGESFTTTDANGTFVLTGGSGPLVAFGGTDISTGLQFAGKLMAPEGSIVITPLTTLLVGGASQSDILAAFNLPAGFDLRLGDPIAGLLAGHAGSAAVFVAGVQVIDTVIAIATAITGLGGDEANAQEDAFTVIAAAVSNLAPGATLDLSNAATIAGLFTGVAQLQGIDASPLAAAVAAAIAASNATIDQLLATHGASAALLTSVSEVQQEIQSNLSPLAIDDSAPVTKGKTLVGNLLANDSDPDGDAFVVVNVAGGNLGTSIAGTYGALVVQVDGSYSYVANKGGLPSGFVAQDTFDYSIVDGLGGAASGTLSVLLLNPNQTYQAGANTTLIGGNGADVLDGSSGLDTLLGGNGPDVLIGGPGNMLTGGNGPDTFLFRPDFGANAITDFGVKNGSDVIQIDKSVFQDVADLFAHTSDTPAGAVIDAGAGNVITLLGVAVAQLQQSDFHLV